MTPFQERVGRATVQWMTGANTVLYRLSGGRVGGHVPSGAPICLLTTTGRKTGRARTVPLLYLRYGDIDPARDGEMVLVASRGGMSSDPAWYLNLRADPRGIVEVGDERRAVVARDATDDERAVVWPRLVDAYPYFASYERRTERRIPVLVLRPTGPAAGSTTDGPAAGDAAAETPVDPDHG